MTSVQPEPLAESEQPEDQRAKAACRPRMPAEFARVHRLPDHRSSEPTEAPR